MKFIRVMAFPSDQHKLVSLGIFIGQYAHLEGYFEAVATETAIERIKAHGFDVHE